MDVWKNKEKSLKMYLKSPWKVLEKGMSWSVGTMNKIPVMVQTLGPVILDSKHFGKEKLQIYILDHYLSQILIKNPRMTFFSVQNLHYNDFVWW